LVNARKMTNPSNSANPVASTPNTPDARSPSLKYPPSGARRRTRRIAAIMPALAVKTTNAPRAHFMLISRCPGSR
jgi:hypothetical protein